MELNTAPSLSIQIGFVIISLIVSCWWIWLFGRAYGISHQTLHVPKQVYFHKKSAVWAGVVIAGWLALTAIAAFQDWAHTFDSFPPPALRVLLLFVVITIFVAYLKPGKILALHGPIWLLIGFQSFRIIVELLIHQAYLEEITVIQMTYLSRNFDIITGVSALLLGFFAYRYTISMRLIFWWNLMGLALLMNVVGHGILSMPHPLQIVETAFPNVWITYFPFIWLPTVLVCSALLGHLLVFRYLALHNKKMVSGIQTRNAEQLQ